MHQIDPKLRKLIYKWLDESDFGYDKVDVQIDDDASTSYSKSFHIHRKEDHDNLLNYYPIGSPSYVFKGRYPLVFIPDNFILEHFANFFSSRHIPVLVDYYSEKMGENLFYRTLIWGDTDKLMDPSIKEGIHGSFDP